MIFIDLTKRREQRAALRRAAEHAAREMLRDLVGPDYSDATLRTAADHLLSFHQVQRRLEQLPPV